MVTLATVLLATAEPDFAARLYGELAAHSRENLFYSPASVRLALAMVHAGARGETATEIRRVLQLSPDAPSADKRLLASWQALAQPDTNAIQSMNAYQEEALARRRIVLHIANRLWGAKEFKFLPAYLSVLRDAYGAPLELLDFKNAAEPSRKTINASVAKDTEGKIPELVPNGFIIESTKLVITNAIYFKASWRNPFAKSRTNDEDFHRSEKPAVKVPMMHQVDHFSLADTADAQVLELPYGDGELVMDIVLPKAALSATESAFVAGGLAQWLTALKPAKVAITLPRYKTRSSADLAKTLEALGMNTLFTFGKADLSGMDGSHLLYVSRVVHQAYVDVNEEGTEAAAATAVGMAAGGMPMPEKIVPFVANKPFLYLIRDTRSKEVLFVGRLIDPSA